ncbi:MAG: Imidazole glycerol phosphate synthase subunit hisH [Gemmatimonadetes bacterium]|jgi:glutamine amidotransferase|nr:Imidazole glycerol phosphate synthase subunit hisH [Gemmatimonadota bacterium]
MKVAIFDYGAGNLHSLAKALERDGTAVTIESDPVRAAHADVLVLPGVGAFGSATERLAPGRDAMRAAILDGLPTIGICLGMQLLFDGSEEGAGAGLGLIPGHVTRLHAVRVPQIGWNEVVPVAGEPLFATAPLPIAYFANSFVARPADDASVIAWTEHEGDRFPSAVRAGSAVGVQFHPEKSSTDGVRFLHAFLDEAGTMKGSR